MVDHRRQSAAKRRKARGIEARGCSFDGRPRQLRLIAFGDSYEDFEIARCDLRRAKVRILVGDGGKKAMQPLSSRASYRLKLVAGDGAKLGGRIHGRSIRVVTARMAVGYDAARTAAPAALVPARQSVVSVTFVVARVVRRRVLEVGTANAALIDDKFGMAAAASLVGFVLFIATRATRSDTPTATSSATRPCPQRRAPLG